MAFADQIVYALLEDEFDDFVGSNERDMLLRLLASGKRPTSLVDLSPAIWDDDTKLRRAFTWLTQLGLAPKFGSVPIQYYQQDQIKAIEQLEALARPRGLDLKWVRSRLKGHGRVIQAFSEESDNWIAFAKIGWRNELSAV